jgi:hypothetical protein
MLYVYIQFDNKQNSEEWNNIPEDAILQSHCCENIKSYKQNSVGKLLSMPCLQKFSDVRNTTGWPSFGSWQEQRCLFSTMFRMALDALGSWI